MKNSENLQRETGGDIENPGQALIAQSSMGGYLVFDQTLKECSETYAQKTFHHCPAYRGFPGTGRTDEEIKKSSVRTFCRQEIMEI